MKSESKNAPTRRMRPAERERVILDGAIALARESGIGALTVRSVASKVGVTPALVAHYRPVMETFVAEVFAEIVSAERAQVFDGFEPGVDLHDTLRRLIETLLDESRDDIAMIWVQSWALGVRNHALAARAREEMDRWQRDIEDLITRVSGADDDAGIDPESSAWMLLAMIDGISAHSLVKWMPRDRSDLARRILAAVLEARPTLVN